MLLEDLLKENEILKAQLSEKDIQIENLKLENNSLKRIIFGSKREKIKTTEEASEQFSMFDDPKKIEENLEEQVKRNVEEITVYRKKKNKTRTAGIKKSKLKEVEIEIKEYALNEDETCPECDGELKLVSKKTVRQEIKYIPAKLVIEEYVQNIYKCTKCGTKGSKKDGSTFVKSEVPKALITHSFASPSLASEVLYQKYYLGVPLYRQEKMWDDMGLVLPRNMMANWAIKITEYYLQRLWDLMQKDLKSKNKVLHCDETTIQCNREPNRKASSNSYMWVYCSGEKENIKGVLFKYSPSRSAETAKEFLKGYKGILVTDGYSSYNQIENVQHAECWAHARRYFYESIPLLENKKMDKSSYGYAGVEYCDKLFKIEEEIALLSDAEKLKIRQNASKQVLDEFYAWVTSTLSDKIITNKKLKEALTYVLNQRKELSEFLNDARIPLTNSLAERSIRPFAVHRKNWLFADSVEGAKANAVMYSLIESAKINKLKIYDYIRYLLENLPQLEDTGEEALKKFLPWSNELPKEILNFQGSYEELKID